MVAGAVLWSKGESSVYFLLQGKILEVVRMIQQKEENNLEEVDIAVKCLLASERAWGLPHMWRWP